MRKRVFKKEADVKAAVKEIFSEAGSLWHFMPVPCGYGRVGVPDFICCYRGIFVAVETKYAKGVLSAHQKIEIRGIFDAGGVVLVINETNLDLLREVLHSVMTGNIYSARRAAARVLAAYGVEVQYAEI